MNVDSYNNLLAQGAIFPFNIDQTLGFASAFYNQLSNTHKFPYINPSGLPNAAQFGYFGSNTKNYGFNSDQRTLGFLPTLTVIHGAHTIRTGINIHFDQWSNPFSGSIDQFGFTNNFSNEWGPGFTDETGYTTGTSIASMLLGYPNDGSVSANAHSFYSQHYFAPWVQDDWKITRKLTLNLGLRWDFLTPRTERHDKLTSVFDATVLNPVSPMIPSGTVALGTNTELQGGLTFAGVNGQPRGAFATNKLDVQPRIGFAYAATDRIVLRGGVGENYLGDESNNGNSGFSSGTTYTNSVDGITPYTACATGSVAAGICAGPGFANPIAAVSQPTGSSLGYLQSLGNGVSFYNPNYHLAPFWSYSMTLDARLSQRDIVTVAYVGNRSPSNPVSNDINHVSPLWNAQCDQERGGNHHLCDDQATGQIGNPFKGIAHLSVVPITPQTPSQNLLLLGLFLSFRGSRRTAGAKMGRHGTTPSRRQCLIRCRIA